MPNADGEQFGYKARIAGHVAADAERFATGKFHGISEQAQYSLRGLPAMCGEIGIFAGRGGKLLRKVVGAE